MGVEFIVITNEGEMKRVRIRLRVRVYAAVDSMLNQFFFQDIILVRRKAYIGNFVLCFSQESPSANL